MPVDPESLRSFAIRYTAAWCSQHPEDVASYFTPNGSLAINSGVPAEGREAITATARSFMVAFPNLVVAMDDLILTGVRPVYHWTLTGTYLETGNAVRISGCEVWHISEDGFIAESQGSFDSHLYQHQLQHGC